MERVVVAADEARMLASTMGSTLRTEALAGGFEGQAPLGRHHRHSELRPRGSDLARCVVALSENVPDYAPVERAEPTCITSIASDERTIASKQ